MFRKTPKLMPKLDENIKTFKMYRTREVREGDAISAKLFTLVYRQILHLYGSIVKLFQEYNLKKCTKAVKIERVKVWLRKPLRIIIVCHK